MAEQEEEKAKAEREQQEDTVTRSDGTIAVDEMETPVAAAAPAVALTPKDFNGNDPEVINGLLEVDDRSDTSEVSIDISAFRMTRYGQRTMAPFTVNRAI
ncbi:hypothetical protein F66182_15174 [Fusarium sp. NRRL 66182]|nr:hypothetical protein F66182_15174 [Fusarium sp. NRRL 66182]